MSCRDTPKAVTKRRIEYNDEEETIVSHTLIVHLFRTRPEPLFVVLMYSSSPIVVSNLLWLEPTNTKARFHGKVMRIVRLEKGYVIFEAAGWLARDGKQYYAGVIHVAVPREQAYLPFSQSIRYGLRYSILPSEIRQNYQRA